MNTEQMAALIAFKKFTVQHHQYKSALETLHKSIATTVLRGEPCGALLLGKPGTGKTSICNSLIAEYGKEHIRHQEESVTIIRPVIYCKISIPATLRGTVSNMISCFDIQAPKIDMNALEQRLHALLKTSETSLVILDEAQQLIQSGAAKTHKAVCDWIKVFADTHDGAFLLVGEPECETIIQHEDALAGRFPYRALLQPFDLSSQKNQQDFFNLIAAFSCEIEKTMNFLSVQPLTDEHIFLGLYILTGGNMRSLRTLLFEALRIAFEDPKNTFGSPELSLASYNVVSPTRLIPVNPFTISLAELKKLIFRST
ncbi:TniB family NTP-binding protein [Pseudomonas xanthosomatis]|uniref:TniB family NTP-binding protein n=1 Tax=Pseudomonas xanthosomatis TaxID=2842356 RepID=UPI00351452E2